MQNIPLQVQHLLKSDCTATCILNADGIIQAFNYPLAKTLRRKSLGITGRTCRDVFNCTKEDETNCPISSIKAKPQKYSALMRHGGSNIMETAEPLFDDSNQLSAILLSFHDNSTLAAMTQNLTKIQRLETIAQTAGGIVHDLNNILMCVDAEISMLRKTLSETGHPGADSHNTLASILSSVSRGQGLTQQLLKFSKGIEPGKEATSLGQIIREAVSFSLIGAHISSTVEIDDELRPVMTNSDQIFQLISNLVINARHSTADRPNGHISVLADNLPRKDSIKLGSPAKDYVRITVSDNGHGIPPEIRKKIFDPFFTTKPEGTGLGLALIKAIVSELSGSISVSSKVNQGTTFTIYLPALDMV